MLCINTSLTHHINKMTHCIAHNISSPLGWTSDENIAAVLEGHHKLQTHEGKWQLKQSFVASLFDDNAVEQRFNSYVGDVGLPLSRFEMLVVLSVKQAAQQADVNLNSSDVGIVIATTKGNVELLSDNNQPHIPRQRTLIGQSANTIARVLGNPNAPHVMCNACISGAHALLFGHRLLQMGRYRQVVVCGCDVQSAFIVSGFQSFHAFSQAPCKPFDLYRDGLNLGEAAATMILSAGKTCNKAWHIEGGAVRNDAYHISSPSKKGEGCYRALAAMGTNEAQELAFVSAHGTATPYNDEMEAKALHRAELQDVPVNALKGIYGHTMGAAGVLETILSMMAVEAQTVLPTAGFSEMGVSKPLLISAERQASSKPSFVKMLSGFGGCNVAMRWKWADGDANAHIEHNQQGEMPRLMPLRKVDITPNGAAIDGNDLNIDNANGTLLTAIYKQWANDYPKFYKMDGLSRLAFAVGELMVKGTDSLPTLALEDNTAIVFVGKSGSLASDVKYQDTISNPDNFFPSPAHFVYTLPNIATGELAIRHEVHGETAFFIASQQDEAQISTLLHTAAMDKEATHVLGGWLEYEDDNHFAAHAQLYKVVRDL